MTTRREEFSDIVSIVLALTAVLAEVVAPFRFQPELTSRPLYQVPDLIPVTSGVLWLFGGIAAVASIALGRFSGRARGRRLALIALVVMAAFALVYAGFVYAFQKFHCYATGG